MIKIRNNNYYMIDAHLHLPWQDDFKTIVDKEKCLIDELNRNNVDRGILIADSLVESSIGNNQECLNVVEKHPHLSMVYGFTPLERYDEQLKEVEELLINKSIIGVKIYPGHDDFSMNDPRLNMVFELCMKYRVPLLIHTEWNHDFYPQYSHPYFIAQIANKFKDLKMICAHIWIPNSLEAIKHTLDCENVYYDMSSFAFDQDYRKLYPKANLIPIDESIKILNNLLIKIPDRIMFGSDFGTLKIDEHIDLVKKLSISDQTLQLLLCENAKKIYGI